MYETVGTRRKFISFVRLESQAPRIIYGWSPPRSGIRATLNHTLKPYIGLGPVVSSWRRIPG